MKSLQRSLWLAFTTLTLLLAIAFGSARSVCSDYLGLTQVQKQRLLSDFSDSAFDLFCPYFHDYLTPIAFILLFFVWATACALGFLQKGADAKTARGMAILLLAAGGFAQGMWITEYRARTAGASPGIQRLVEAEALRLRNEEAIRRTEQAARMAEQAARFASQPHVVQVATPYPQPTVITATPDPASLNKDCSPKDLPAGTSLVTFLPAYAPTFVTPGPVLITPTNSQVEHLCRYRVAGLGTLQAGSCKGASLDILQALCWPTTCSDKTCQKQVTLFYLPHYELKIILTALSTGTEFSQLIFSRDPLYEDPRLKIDSPKMKEAATRLAALLEEDYRASPQATPWEVPDHEGDEP